MDYTPGKTTIRSKSGYGSNLSYGINGTKPHALASFQPGSSQTLNPIQHITYTNFKKVKRLSIFEGTTYLDITYGVDEQRIKSVYGTPSGATTRYYLGSYEEEIVNGNTKKIHYLSAGDGLAAIYVQNSGSQDSLYYAYTDYQGSLIAVTDKGGNLREHYAYDAWGLRRNPDDWTKNDTRTAFLFTRGYTFHEHIPEFNLINMNGRMYDPGAGLFFSPDPYIQSPGDWLNYNRYTYCLNNPLIYTDPSGESLFIVFAATTIINALNAGFEAMDNGGNFWDGFGINLAMSAITTGLSVMTGLATVPGMLSNGLLSAGLSVGTNGLTNLIQGNKFMDGWFVSALSGFAGGAKIGYDQAKEAGANYWWGTPSDKWGYNKGAKSFIPWTDRADELNYQSGEMVYESKKVRCDAMSFAATHGGTGKEWQARLDEDWNDYEPFYKREGFSYIETPEKEKNFAYLQQLHADGYNRAHLRVTNYGESNATHRMVVKKIRHIPGKLFEVTVLDPGNGLQTIIDGRTFSSFKNVYDLNTTTKFKLNKFTLFK